MKALVDPFNNEKALEGVFSGHCATSQRLVDSSTGDQHTLIGVTSWGQGGGAGATCGDSSVFARVSHFRPWIDDNMKNTQFCKFAGNSDQTLNK